MKTITTKYLGPTISRGARFKATDHDGNTITLSYDYSLTSSANHQRACRALCQKMGWSGELIGGHQQNGMVWVFANSPDRFTTTKGE